MINMLEIATKAQWRIREHKEYVEGVKMAIGTFKQNKIYNGDNLSFIKYLTSKIDLASTNIINNCYNLKDLLFLHMGYIALLNAMIQVMIEIEEGKNK